MLAVTLARPLSLLHFPPLLPLPCVANIGVLRVVQCNNYSSGLRSFCRSAARVQEMQTVVAIMLIGSVVMVAIAALDQPNS
ncbi:hypothetical protein [Xanthobacter flavus]|uniref:hypothetical protein n=1 Tax=Xanthobacter flavus TaxID=281 RepID=UPI00372C36FD